MTKRRTALTVLRTGLAYDKVIKDIDRRELRSESVDKNWGNYIEIARGLLAVAEVSRMAVAEVAIRATLIKCGGDRHSLNFKTSLSRLTIKAFATSIGVKPNTLWLWMRIKERVFEELPEKERAKFKHDDGEKTLKLLGVRRKAPTELVQQTYAGLRDRGPEQRSADRAVKLVMSLRKVFLRYKRYLNDEQIEAIKFGLLEILKKIEEKQ